MRLENVKISRKRREHYYKLCEKWASERKPKEYYDNLSPELQVLEAEKCEGMGDPIKGALYYMITYVKIFDKDSGKAIPFDLFYAQIDVVIDLFIINLISNKTRQSGFTWIADAYSDWLSKFAINEDILIMSIKDDAAQEQIWRINFITDNLPEFMKSPRKVDNRKEIEYEAEQQGRIRSVPTSDDSTRGKTPTFVFWDEMAFPQKTADPDKIYLSLIPSLETGRLWLNSTPNGMNGKFYEMFKDADSLGYKKIEFHWSYDPRKCKKHFAFFEERRRQGLPHVRPGDPEYALLEEEEWYKRERRKYPTQEDWNQEQELSFLTSSRTVFDLNNLQEHRANLQQPIEIRYGYCHIYAKPIEGRKYIAAADPAEGKGNDNSSFKIFDMTTFEEVVDFATNKIKVEVFARLCYELLKEYNFAYIIPEKNNYSGGVFITELVHLNYSSRIYRETEEGSRKGEYGFFTHATTKKNILVAGLRDALSEKSITIRSRETIEELESFIEYENKKLEAAKGAKDDRVMCLCLLVYGIKSFSLLYPVDIPLFS